MFTDLQTEKIREGIHTDVINTKTHIKQSGVLLDLVGLCLTRQTCDKSLLKRMTKQTMAVTLKKGTTWMMSLWFGTIKIANKRHMINYVLQAWKNQIHPTTIDVR